MTAPRTQPSEALDPGRPDDPVVVFDNVSYFGGLDPAPLFTELSFTLGRGEAVVLTGAIGSGKSSVLRLALGALRPTRGTVRVLGRDPAEFDEVETPKMCRRIGCVQQRGALISNLTLYENLVLPLRYHLEPDEDEVRARAQDALKLVGLNTLPQIIPPQANRQLNRKVALARAMILKPDLLVLDEPAEAFDEQSGRDLWACVKGLMSEFGVAILGATNDAGEAEPLTDNFLYLAAPQAAVLDL